MTAAHVIVRMQPCPLLWRQSVAAFVLLALYTVEPQELILLAASTLLATMALSAGAGAFLTSRMRLKCQWPETAHAGTLRTLRVSVRNEGWLPSPPCVVSAQLVGTPDVGSVPFGLLGTDEAAEGDLELAMSRRGVYKFAALEVACRVLGCFRVRRRWLVPINLVVHPRVCVLSEKQLGPGSPFNTLGTGNLPLAGHDIEFLGVREYSVGDSPRLVHWRTSARRGRLFVKEFARSSRADVTLFLDLGSPGPWTPELSEEVVTAAASVIHLLSGEHVRYQLLASGRELTHVRFGAGKPQVLHAMHVLTQAVHGGNRDAGKALYSILSTINRPGGLMVFCPFPAAPLLDLLEGLAGQGVCVSLLTPWHRNVPLHEGEPAWVPVGPGGRQLRFPVIQHSMEDLDRVLWRLA